MTAPESRATSIESLLATKEIVIFCGSGGVGKTSVAAAAGVAAATRLGGKVLVLTIDPARRLANALGLEDFGNVEKPVPVEAFKAAGLEPRGQLHAAMLDTKRSWDELVLRHAPDEETAYRILENRLYTNITGRFVQSHDYIAMERLFDVHAAGRYDLIIIDTPPTRNAIDFLEAPRRMADFFGGRLLRWLTMPYRMGGRRGARVLNVASRPFYQLADRILGSQFLQDIAEFFMLFQTMYDGFVQRAKAVERLLHDKRTTFMVVSTLEAAPLREAEQFIEVMAEKKFHLGAVILNKVLPEYMRSDRSAEVADRLLARGAELSEALAPGLAEPGQVQRVLTEVAESFLNFQVVACREAEQQSELAVTPEVVASVPFFETDIYDLAGLVRLGERIWS